MIQICCVTNLTEILCQWPFQLPKNKTANWNLTPNEVNNNCNHNDLYMYFHFPFLFLICEIRNLNSSLTAKHIYIYSFKIVIEKEVFGFIKASYLNVLSLFHRKVLYLLVKVRPSITIMTVDKFHVITIPKTTTVFLVFKKEYFQNG